MVWQTAASVSMQWRERAIREKQTAERAKNTADSQLDELNSQQADDPEGANAALRDTLNDIADKDLQIRDLQRQVTATSQCLFGSTAYIITSVTLMSLRLTCGVKFFPKAIIML